MRLAVEGPFNGQYITRETALSNGYEVHQWPSVGHGEGEKVWLHHAHAHIAELEAIAPDDDYEEVN